MQEENMRKLLTAAVLLAGILSFGLAEAVPTKLIVRARSKDAKFVGTSMGGAHILVKDSETGKVLAEGLTAGGTGNTRKIMVAPHMRFVPLTDSSTAKFETVIDIDEPRLVTIDVEAPYGFKPDTIKSTTQIWLIPGRDLVGDGVIIEVPGFQISTRTSKEVKMAGSRAVIPIEARIVMI
jgi:hypothetical protein